jgi:NitT/TauT family transport system substrate-binding protein
MAHIEVTQQIQTNTAAAIPILNAELKKETGKALAAEVIGKAMGRVEFTWDPISSSLFKSAQAAHDVGFIRKTPDLKGIYDLSLLQEILKEKSLPPVQEISKSQ